MTKVPPTSSSVAGDSHVEEKSEKYHTPADFGWAKSGSTVASSYIDELRGPLSNALLLVVKENA
jgi:hypothetical protein